MTLYEKFQSLPIEPALISLERREDIQPYFCYPVNAVPIGFEGCIMYCFIKEYGEMVFAANPESCAQENVYPLAAGFQDFLRLILACGSANPVEQIVWMDEKGFARHVREERESQTAEQAQLLAFLARELGLMPMEEPFAYVKALQSGFDGSGIQYSDEYYDVLGLERPDGTEAPKGGARFEHTIVFTISKK